MITKAAAVFSAVLLCSSAVGAQDVPSPEPGPQKPPDVSKEVRPPEPSAQPVNVRIDLTITDEATPTGPAKRTVTMIVADRTHGSIRSTGNQVQARLYVDAAPHILADGNVQVQLGLQYNPQLAGDPGTPPHPLVPPGSPKPVGGSSLQERITVVLRSGKPLIVSQASDPLSERKITVELRAEILK